MRRRGRSSAPVRAISLAPASRSRTGRYIGDADDAGEEVASRLGEISDRTGEIVPAYGLLQSERELASARIRQPAAAAGAMTRDAVIVSTARTPIGRAYRGAFNNTPPPTLAAHVLNAAVSRAGVEPGEVDDCLLGCSLPQGGQHMIGRMAALRAGFPVTVPGMTLDRQCSSGLMTIATAAKQIIVDRMDIVVAGGVESISLVQTPELRIDADPALAAMHADAYMPMIETAEVVAARYGIDREQCDRYALRSQQRTAAAQAAGRFSDEIVPVRRDDENGRQGERRNQLSRRHAGEGRGVPAGHDDRRTCRAEDRDFRWHGHRRQREPTFRWRIGLRRDGGADRRTARARPARPLPRHGGSRHEARRDGYRARLRGAAVARTLRPGHRGLSTCGSSTRPSPCRSSIAATGWAFRTTGSM